MSDTAKQPTTWNREVLEVLTARERKMITECMKAMHYEGDFTKLSQRWVLQVVTKFYQHNWTNAADTLIRKLQHIEPLQFTAIAWEDKGTLRDPDWDKGYTRIVFKGGFKMFMKPKSFQRFLKAPFKSMVRDDLF